MQQATISISVQFPAPTTAMLNIEGELTAASENALMDAYTEGNQANVNTLILNFNDLEYMNSSGIGLLVTLLVRVNRNRQRLVAIGLNDHYQQIFEVTRLNEAIEIYATEAEALGTTTP